MTKTFNRAPITVQTPSSSDIKQYFFNQYNWKGLNDDKNILAVDQETFSDCNNVYVDEEGLLKSRPSLKIKTVTRTEDGQKYTLSNIVDVWSFEDVMVYQTNVNNIYYLTFVNKNFENNVQVPLEYTDDGATKYYKDVKLIVADRKIFVFSEHSLSYYDISENIYADATDFIYVPVTNVIVDGVASSSTEIESPNALTTSYITKYLYTSTDNIDFDNFVGKEITVEVDVTNYLVNFVYNNELVFVNRYTGLSTFNFADDKIAGKAAEGLPLVEPSETDSMLVSSYSYTIDEATKIPTITWNIYHTVDGIIFTQLPETDGIIGLPKISRDGIYAFVFKNDGPYVYSLLKSTGKENKKYGSWTNLLQSVNSSDYTGLNLSLNTINDVGSEFNQSRVVNGYFRDDSVFAFTYGTDLINKNSNEDPEYRDFYCIYSVGDGNIYKKAIFESSPGTVYNYEPTTNNVIQNIIANLNPGSTTNNVLKNMTIQYVDTVDNSSTATTTISNLQFSYDGNHTASLTGNVVTLDSSNNSLSSDTLKFTNTQYDISQNWTNISNGITYTITSTPGTTSGNYKLELKITASSMHGYIDNDSNSPIILYKNAYIGKTSSYTPNVYIGAIDELNNAKIIIDFVANIVRGVSSSNSSTYRAVYAIEHSTGSGQRIVLLGESSNDNTRSPLKNAILAVNNKYTLARVRYSSDNQWTQIISIEGADSFSYYVERKNYSAEDFYSQTLVLSDPNAYLLTNSNLYNTSTDYDKITPIPLLFNSVPVKYYYSGNVKDAMYVATDNALYSSNLNQVITVSELTRGKINYLLPSFVTELSNYYLSKGNTLYISSPAVDISVDKSGAVSKKDASFKWYLPERAKQDFDFNITNLHVISNTEVAIFFEHSIRYVSWDNDISAYRYYKSKLDVGCKAGSDVLTTYDGKYTIFATDRGLVAMTYQEFMATTEQALSYLSDNIYSVFRDFANNEPIKLFKYAFWIFVYKQGSDKLLLFDIRNSSWWPMSLLHSVTKIFKDSDKLEVLLNKNVYKVDTKETNYYDKDTTKHNISWFIKSQKLYLNAINYYKHITNITFMSVHDMELLQSSNYNIDNSDFRLQINNYRKRVNGNIGDDTEYVAVSYNIESIRTFVQRLNYSKVNEFEYLLSSNNSNSINIPLSLNSITIKYKIGTQVR